MLELFFTKVVDTPGFGDSSGRDNQLIAEMMEILDNELGFTNTIVLLIDGNTPRFSSGLYDMLRYVLYCTVQIGTIMYFATCSGRCPPSSGRRGGTS